MHIDSRLHLAPEHVPVPRVDWDLPVCFGYVSCECKGPSASLGFLAHQTLEVRCDRRPLLIAYACSAVFVNPVRAIKQNPGGDDPRRACLF